MRGIDVDKLTGRVEPLTRFFYAMLGVALLAVLFGSPASALFFLVVGALAQVVRASIQELLWQRQGEVTAAPARTRPARRPVAQRTAAERDATRQPIARPQASRRRAAASR